MKRIAKIAGISFSLAAVFGLASCSNEVNEPANNIDNGTTAPVFNLLKAPDAIAWSGATTYGNTFGDTKGLVIDEKTGKSTYLHNEEVEVNLSVLDGHVNYDVADLVTKLSIHVRCATDVTVFIPVDASYIIESDDLYIFHEHYKINDQGKYEYQGKYGATGNKDFPLTIAGAKKSITYNVGGSDVTLSIEAVEGGIEIKTDGITEEVIEACFGYNKDGLNFEIYNYYQTAQVEWNENSPTNIVTGILEDDDIVAIMTALNESTITFTHNPNYYINAFGYAYTVGGQLNNKKWAMGIKGTDPNPYDCKVVPTATGLYNNDPETQIEHLNGTPYNDIWVITTDAEGKAFEADDAHIYHEKADADDDEEEDEEDEEEEEVVSPTPAE